MKVANITDFKNHLSSFFALVEKGEEIQIQKRNIPIALVTPIKKKSKNMTRLGCGKGSIKIKCDLTETLIPLENWKMFKNSENNT
jgi:antitoxin (DNA-binding transcriptional repressor) of toxin-antitoxin stability system